MVYFSCTRYWSQLSYLIYNLSLSFLVEYIFELFSYDLTFLFLKLSATTLVSL